MYLLEVEQKYVDAADPGQCVAAGCCRNMLFNVLTPTKCTFNLKET
jgi:hypothetical protein